MLLIKGLQGYGDSFEGRADIMPYEMQLGVKTLEKGIIFDFDGVIINSSEVQRQALFESYKLVVGDDKTPSFEEFFSHSGDSLCNILRKMDLPLAMIEPYRNISRKRRGLIKVYQGIRELIIQLKSEGFKCGLCTGKDRDRTVEILKELDLLQLFDTVVCSDDVENPKPSPDSLLFAINNIGIRCEDVVMIGDARNDILCARSVGVKNIAVTWGDVARSVLEEESPDYIVNTMDELYAAITSCMGRIKPLQKYLVNDFVIAEDNCNMNCLYCLTDISEFKEKHKRPTCKSAKTLNYLTDVKLKENIDGISHMITSNFDVAILKVSGGELLLTKNIMEYIKQQAEKYKVVQILTNGLLLNDNLLKEIKSVENVCLQISIDHYTMDGNYYRTGNDKVHKLIIRNIEKVVEYGIPLEINCVLTDKNTPIIDEFCDYLLKYKGSNIMLFMFPVRGANRDLFYPKPDQLAGIEKIIENYDRYESIMAPKVYLEHLLGFLKRGSRELRCIVGGMTIGTFDDGTVTPCSNYWFTSIGNLLDENSQETVMRIGTDKIYRLLMNKRNRIGECSKCFTPWETLNLYGAGLLSIEELCRSPLYSFPGVRGYIVDLNKKVTEETDSYDELLSGLRKTEC